MAQFSLSWNSFKDNICSGLTALQQNGEFVDMTIAADGHHVKVHQMVMSLVSPYIKDLISSAQCPHPVIFLNKIEIATQNLSQAAFAIGKTDEGQPLSTREFYKTKEKPPNVVRQKEDEAQPTVKRIRRSIRESYYSENDHDDHMNDSSFHDTMDTDQADSRVTDVNTKEDTKIKTPIQYTVSNQGAIQMIVNRYLFKLRYTSVRDDGIRRWLCTNSKRGTCKATVFTQGGVIVKRCAAHNHPYHDERILKKVKANLVFSALNDVEAVVKKQKTRSEQEHKATSRNKNTDRENTDAEEI